MASQSRVRAGGEGERDIEVLGGGQSVGDSLNGDAPRLVRIERARVRHDVDGRGLLGQRPLKVLDVPCHENGQICDGLGAGRVIVQHDEDRIGMLACLDGGPDVVGRDTRARRIKSKKLLVRGHNNLLTVTIGVSAQHEPCKDGSAECVGRITPQAGWGSSVLRLLGLARSHVRAHGLGGSLRILGLEGLQDIDVLSDDQTAKRGIGGCLSAGCNQGLRQRVQG